MRFFFTLIMVIINFIAFGQSNEISSDYFLKIIYNQTEDFIRKVESKSNIRESRPIYILYIHNLNVQKGEICFTLGYILNDFELDIVQSEGFYRYKDNYVLLTFSDAFKKDVLLMFSSVYFKFQKHEESLDENHLRKILFSTQGFSTSSPPRGITYVPKGVVYCKEGSEVASKFYPNANEIPIDVSIYHNWPVGEIKEVIE